MAKLSKKNIVIAVIVLFIIIGFFVWNNYQIQIIKREEKPITFPPQTSSMCGIENCHGLDIVCGPNPVEMCTMEYQLGDKCRQFAFCGDINGNCRQIENEQFTKCKSCVEQCERDSANDILKIFSCESKCGE